MTIMISLDQALDLEELLGDMLFTIEGLIEQIELNDDNPVEWEYASRKAEMEKATRFVFALQLPVACYPLSVAAAYTLDEPLCP